MKSTLYDYNSSYMQEAINKALEGISQGQSPFGACIVKDDIIIALEHNQVCALTDITAHAEITAIRKACYKLKTIDLTGCMIYATCEPCVMCFGACNWANFDAVIYGASVWDAFNRKDNKLVIANHKLIESSSSDIIVIGGVLKEQCKDLFKIWSAKNPEKSC